VVDDWILNQGYKKTYDNIHLVQIENDNEVLKSKVVKWIKELNNIVTEKIDVEWIYDSIEQLEAVINSKSDELYKLRWDEEKLTKDIKKIIVIDLLMKLN